MTTRHRVAVVTILIVISWLLALPFRTKNPELAPDDRIADSPPAVPAERREPPSRAVPSSLTSRPSAPITDGDRHDQATAAAAVPGFLHALSPWGTAPAISRLTADGSKSGRTATAAPTAPPAHTSDPPRSSLSLPLIESLADTSASSIGASDFLPAPEVARVPSLRATRFPELAQSDFERDSRAIPAVVADPLSATTAVGQTDIDHRIVTAPVGTTSARYHRIVNGDSLPLLAGRYYGNPRLFLVLFEANRDVLASPDVLPIGVELRLP